MTIVALRAGGPFRNLSEGLCVNAGVLPDIESVKFESEASNFEQNGIDDSVGESRAPAC